MLLSYRGRQYDTTHTTDVDDLAWLLRMPVCIAHLRAENAPQNAIDGALWQRILEQVPGSLTGDQLAGGAR